MWAGFVMGQAYRRAVCQPGGRGFGSSGWSLLVQTQRGRGLRVGL